MILKAIVDKVLDKYNIRVRIPELDRAEYNASSTSRDDLNVAIICTLPGFDLNLQEGDIVFVSFEPNGQCLILGCLFRKSLQSLYSDASLNSIDIFSEANLPYKTTIGNVSSQSISMLEGCDKNINSRFNSIEEQINNLQKRELISPSGKKFKLTVDDNGILNVEEIITKDAEV